MERIHRTTRRELYTIAVIAGGMLFATGALCAEDTSALMARLHDTDRQSALNVEGMSPWHLKLAIQLCDEHGKPSEDATVEEWWRDTDTWRIVYTAAGKATTEARSAAGLFRSKGGESPPARLETLLQAVTHPMPDMAEIDASTPYLQRKDFANVPLDCIMLSQPLPGVPYPPLGLYPTYCFDPAKGTLRASYNYGSQLTIRNALGRFMTKSVSLDTTILEAGIRSAEAKVITLESLRGDAPDLDKMDDLVQVPARPEKVPGGVVAGMIVNKIAPTYPEGAKERHVSGTVLLHAIIGRDGRVHSLKFLQVPDAELAMSAMAAVRQWRYKPYLLDGEPVEVDTTITVHFNFGPA